MLPELRRLAVRAKLRRMALDSRPIICGPWRSELGFEGLYWVPFLRWAVKTYGINPDRLVILTRGGADVLYGVKAIDLYTLRSPDTVRRENLYDYQRTKLQKQMEVTGWDRWVMREAADTVCGKGAKVHWLHPSWMYWALAPYWDEARGLKYLLSMTDYTPIPKPPLPAGVPLPEKFVAVKWYARHTFPLTQETQQFLEDISTAVGSRTNLVLLTSGTQADEHADVLLDGPNITKLPAVPAEQNLALQIAVLSRATAFLGVYGGMAQLALRLGVPSVSFYHEWGGTAEAHHALSQFISRRTGVPFLTGSLSDSHLWMQVLTKATAPAQAQGSTTVYSAKELANAAV